MWVVVMLVILFRSFKGLVMIYCVFFFLYSDFEGISIVVVFIIWVFYYLEWVEVFVNFYRLSNVSKELIVIVLRIDIEVEMVLWEIRI